MKRRYLLFRRKRGGMSYLEDTNTRKQESLGTKNRTEALTLLAVRNESARQPQLNLQVARTYLEASDPEAIKRTRRVPLEEIAKTKKGPTRERWLRVQKDTAFELIRDVPLLETRPKRLLKVMEIGTVATNEFLRHSAFLGRPSAMDVADIGSRFAVHGHFTNPVNQCCHTGRVFSCAPNG